MNGVWGQTTGDYRTRQDGTWGDRKDWQRWNGNSWDTPTNGQGYPGQFSSPGTVTILDAHDIVLNLTPPHDIGNLVIGNGTSGTLQTDNSNRTLDIAGNLILATGATYNLERTILTVNGSATINGTVTDSNDNGSVIFTGLVNITNTGSFSTNNNSAFTFRGGIINNGIFTKSGTGLTTFDTGNQIISGSNDLTFSGGNITVANNITVTNQGSVSVSGVLNGAGASAIWTNGANSTLNYYNTTQPMGTGILTATASGNIVKYGMDGTQTVRGVTYYDLALSNSNAKITTGVTVNGTLSLEGTATASAAITYGPSAGLKYITSNARIATDNEWPATFNGTGGVILASVPQITLNGAKVFGLNAPLTINSGASLSTGNNDLTFGGNFVNNGGTFTAGVSNFTITNTGIQIIAGFSTTGTVSLNKTGGTATLQGNVNAVGFNVNGTGGTINLGVGLIHSFSGSFNMSNGTLNGGSSVLRFGGVVNAAGGNFVPGTGTVEFYGGAQAVPGITYNNLTISGGNIKTITNNVRINGDLNLTNGVLALGSSNLVLGPGASTSGTFSSSGMIDIGNRSVTKEGNVYSDFVITLPVGTGTAYTPVDILSLSATNISSSSTISIRSFATPASGVTGSNPLGRHWITSTTGISGSVVADISFLYLPSDIPTGGTQSLYEIIYEPSTGTWGKPGGASAAGANPLRASAATSLDATWTASEPEKRVFYSLKSGSWNDPATWTLDPSGTQWLNPNSYTPENSPTAAFDEVIILSGRIVTVPGNNMSNLSLTVHGTLDLGVTSGHSFATIAGTGRIRLAADNFPAGDASDFITQGEGEGTIEYYGASRNLTTDRTFYNMDVNMTTGQALYMVSDYILNGNVTVTNGILNFNNNSSTAPVVITVYGNFTVSENGRIITGTANARHQLNLYGDFVNNGESRFTNRTAPVYTSEATDGIVDVNFLNAFKNQSILCNGITNFYRIEIDKGTDFTYILSIDATNADYFKLYGYADEGHGSVLQLTSNNNALGLLKGTVRIGNNITIPVLSQNSGNYNISESAQLWIDGGSVSRNTGTAIVVYGKIRITDGTLEVLINSGITFRENGMVSVEGGTINANQIRTTTEGSSTYGGYVQTGGVVNVLGGSVNPDFYVFSLPFPSSVFNMSGGTLKVNTSTSNGAILINSAPENIKVTGGTVIAETQSSSDFRITSTAPFWNLELQNPSTGAREFALTAANDIGPANLDVPAQPLKVLHDFRLFGKESGGPSYPAVVFNPGINDVYIGGSFFIEDGARYIPISGGTAPYDAISNQPTSRNTTFLNQTTGTGNVEELYQGNVSAPLELGNLVVERTNGYEVRLTSAASRVNETVILDVNGSVSVLSGTLNQNLFTVRTWGSITNNDRIGTWVPGVTPSRAQIQFVENAALTLSTADGAVFGNVQVNVTPPSMLTLTSNVFIERMEYVKGLIYLKNFNLKIDVLWNMEQGIFENSSSNSYLKIADIGHSGNSLIFTDGKASDGGLSLKISANSQAENQPNILNNTGPTSFPVGFTTNGGATRYFRPAQMVVKNFADDGYVTIRPVLGSLATLDPTGGEVLQQFWRVSSEGFNTAPTVSFRFYYRNRTGGGLMDLIAVNSSNEATYVPGKVKDGNPYTRLYEPLADNDILKNIGPSNTRIVTFNGTSQNGDFSPSVTGFPLENANFTAGASACFAGAPTHFYTNASGDWHMAANWDVNSIGSGLHAVPTEGSIVHIYNNSSNPAINTFGRINVRAAGMPHSPAEVLFEMPNISPEQANSENIPRLQFWVGGTYTLGFVRGRGMISFGANAIVINGDFGDFGTNPNSYYLFFGGPAQLTAIPTPIPNMMIEYETDINQNIVVNYDLVIQGDAQVRPLQNIDIRRDLVLGFWMGGTFQFPATGNQVNVSVGRDIDFTRVPIAGAIGNRILNTSASPGALVHKLILKRSIMHGSNNNFSIDLYGSPTQSKAILEFQGNENGTYSRTSTSIPVLYQIVMNKGNSQAPTFSFNNSFTLEGSTNGAVKAITMLNGTLILNSAAIDLNLTTGANHFAIPGTSSLNVVQGTVRASGTSGLSLDGRLNIAGGNVDMSGGDNPIEYSASGNATISVSSGNLTIGGQVRRSLTSDVGILNYSQSGGTVIVGNNSATVGHRGVFEILNPGSSFTMTGGDLFIARAQTSPSIAAFYFDPSDYDIGNSANIHIGHSSTPAGQTIGIYALKPLPRLRINNSGSLIPKVTARLETVPATITSMLQVDAGTTFNANGLDLTLSGDLDVAGTFNPNGNTTFFNGTGVQNINGYGVTLNLYNLDKTGSNHLSLNAGTTSLLISNSLYLRNGTVSDNGNTIAVKGRVVNNAIHLNNGTGDGILMRGDAAQELSGNGTFGKLTVNNPMGVNVPVGNEFIIDRSLKMQSGVFNIGSNLLSLGVDAVVEEASPFSSINMIETNLSFTDNGLKKTFRAGSSPIFTFPIGSNSKYTPVTLTISSNANSTGSITVRPANEMHPGIIEDSEAPGPEIVDQDNVLQHYWSLRTEGITGFSAQARMYFLATDVKVTPPYTVADYHTASLLNEGSGTWLKFPKADFDAANKRLNFSFTNTDDSQISGDYTAGAGDASLVGAIPSIVTSYETVASGNWVNDPIWTPNVSGGPGGAIIRINAAHTVDVTSNYRSVYKSEIYGTLNLNATFGHRLGVVDGSGTIYFETGDMPAAIYYNFFQPAGGTLEFGGSSDYEFLGNITGINHLKLSGAGQRKFPNNNLTLNGNLTIDGVSGLQVINYFNRTIYIKGNLSRISGSFDAGTGPNAIVSLKGPVPQLITGSFSDNNAFNILEVNNINNITLDDEVEIDRELLLVNGLVNAGPAGSLRMNFNSAVNPSAGTPLSFVNGTLEKELLNGNSFTFAIGSLDGSTKNHGPARLMSVAGPSGIHDWGATYYYSNAASVGFDTESFQTPISTVSKSEYWKMEGPAGGSARISIILDGSSDVASSLTDLSNLRIAGWNAAEDEWEIVGTGANVTGTSTSGTITTTSPVVFDNYTYFTLASVIPVIASTATITSPASVNICSGSSTTITVAFTGEMPYVLTYTQNGTYVTTPAINTSTYDINVTPSSNTAYILTGMTANGTAGLITGTSSVTVTVNPLPTVVISRSGSGAICENASITFTATAGLSNYNFRVNSITVQNGPANVYTTNTLVTSTVDVVGTNAGGCSATSNPLGVTVNPLPGAAGGISGPASVCRGSNGVYSIAAIPNATSYSWSATNGAVISPAGSTTKTITFPNAGTSTITVYGVNSCGSGSPSTFIVAVNTASTPGAAGSITGPAQVCRGGSGYTYSVSPVANATSYIWQYTGTGATINGTANSVTVDFAPGATGGNLRVAGTNGCATGTYSPNYAINVNQPPTATISPASPSICSGSPLSLTGTPAGGTAPYVIHSWSGAGAVYLSAANIPDPVFNSPSGGNYLLSYSVTDSRGCIGNANIIVTVSQAPVAEAGNNITGLCSGIAPVVMAGAAASGSYSGTPTWSGSGGTWTQNPDPALATFTPSIPTGSTVATLTLTGANGCSNVTDTRIISWNSIPVQPGNFTVSSSIVCQGQTGIAYTIPIDPMATSYNWSYTIGSGVTIDGSGTSVTLNFSSSATAGSLNVTAINSCGTSIARSIAITVDVPPVATFSYSGTPYCSDETDPLPAMAPGAVKGIFSASAGGLSINASTGAVDLSLSTPGTYTVTNTIAAAGGCGNVTSTASILITALPIASFSYSGTPYCSDEADPLPVMAPGAVKGTFSASSGGLSINAVTGAVDLSSSTPDTYIVTNTIVAAGGCGIVTSTATIEISALQITTFSYSGTPYCSDEADPLPSMAPGAVKGIFSASAGGLSINASTGAVDLSLSTPGTYTVTNTIAAAGGCGAVISTASILITTLPIASFSYTGNPYCPTASDPLPLFSGGGVAGSFSANPAGLVFVNALTGQVDLSASIPGVYTVTNTIAAAGGCGIVTASNSLEITRDYVWTGSSGTSWNAAGNWSCGIVPSGISSILIPDVANKPVLSSGAEGAVNNLTIAPGASLTVTGNTLKIAGTILSNGAIDVSSGKIELNGTALQSIPDGTFTANKVFDLTVNNLSGVTLLGALNLSGILYLQNGNLASDDHLTLISDALGTALIDGTGTGNVTGNVTMQRYLSSGFGYKYFSSPFQNATVEEFHPEVSLIPAPSFPPIYKYVENRMVGGVAASGWEKYHTLLTNPLVRMAGYSVNFGNISSPKTVDITGIVSNGDISVTLYNNNQTYTKGFNLVGNPYPSPVDWNAAGWTKTNIDNALYFFKASATDQYGGTYSTYINGESTGGATNVIASMQGFFVHVSNGPPYPVTGTLAVSNSVRINNPTPVFFKKSTKSASDRSRINISAGFSANESLYDPLVIYLDEKGTNNFDGEADALKFFNTDFETPNFYSLADDGSQLSINALPEPNERMQPLPLGVFLRKSGEVVFKLREITGIFAGSDVYFFDSATGTASKLGPDMEYKVYLNAGSYNSRFSINFDNLATKASEGEADRVPLNIYSSGNQVFAEVNCITDSQGILTIYNVTGRAVYNTKIYENGSHEFYPNVKDGIYIVGFVAGNIRVTQKVFIKER